MPPGWLGRAGGAVSGGSGRVAQPVIRVAKQVRVAAMVSDRRSSILDFIGILGKVSAIISTFAAMRDGFRLCKGIS